jgi:predicted phage replisome organizer/uncharacterized phage protein (TIGR02220 family)
MADVQWIKIATQIFDNRKIKQIEKMPEGDAIIVVWFKLLCLAGTSNKNGMIYLTEEIPYTDEMLATEFGMEQRINVLRLALKTFEHFKMIEIIDSVFYISSWEKYQNIEGLDKIREQNRIRQARYKESQKLLSDNVISNVTGNAEVTQGNAIDKDIDKESDKDIEIYKNIIDYFNQKAGTNYKHSSKATQKHINGRLADGFTFDDFKAVIDKKVTEWNHEPIKGEKDMRQYLRPETLFGTKFEGYLNTASSTKIQAQPKQSKFNQYPQRTYTAQDYANLEKKLLNKGL